MSAPLSLGLSALVENFLLEPSWKTVLNEEFSRDYFISLNRFLEKEEEHQEIIYPPKNQIFAAFNKTPFQHIKIVVLGQDPYHNEGQANGFCFSVADGVRKPPSLVNIFKELNEDVGVEIPENGNLEIWANQGVFLLNAVLTVRAGHPGSHQKKGWELFTNAVIKKISDDLQGVVFLLWGNYAREKGQFIDRSRHLVLEAPHPSPLARGGFKGCKHFSKANAYLHSIGKPEVNWNLNNRET